MPIPARCASLGCILLLALLGATAAQFDTFAGPNRCTCHCCDNEDDEGCDTGVIDANNRGACNVAACATAFEKCATAATVKPFFHDCECSCTHQGHQFKTKIAVPSRAECNEDTCAAQVPTFCDEATHVLPTFLDCDCGCCEDGCTKNLVHTVGAGSREECNPDLCRGLLYQCPAQGHGTVEALYLNLDASGSQNGEVDPVPSLLPGVTNDTHAPEVVIPDCICACNAAQFSARTGSVESCTEEVCRDLFPDCASEDISISARYDVGRMPNGLAQLLMSQQVSGLAAWEIVLLTLGIVAILVVIVLGIVCIVRSVRGRRYANFDKEMVTVRLPEIIDSELEKPDSLQMTSSSI